MVTWGHRQCGGDSTDVADQLTVDVVRVYSTSMAFLALKRDGNVVTWGDRLHGGVTPLSVRDQLDGCVERVYSNAVSWVVITNVGRVVTWGWDFAYQETNRLSLNCVSEQVVNVVHIAGWPNKYGFAALLSGGKVVKRGSSGRGRRQLGRGRARSSSRRRRTDICVFELRCRSHGRLQR